MELKAFRKEKKLTQQEMASLLGISRTAYTNIENGKRQADYNILSKLSEIFAVSINEILGTSSVKTGIKIPVLGYVRAGIPIEAVEEIIDYEEISQQMATTGEFFALKIKGDSMEPRIVEGDVIIVRKQPDVNNGEIAVVLVENQDATVKKIKKNLNGISLQSYNHKYDDIDFTNEQIAQLPVQIIGRMMELRGKF